MLHLLLAALGCFAAPELPPLAAAGASRPLAAANPAAAEDKSFKALDAWLKQYRTGKVALRANPGKDSIAAKYGLAPKGGLGNPTWAGDLELICGAVAGVDGAAAAAALLEVAAIGVDHGKYSLEMQPYEVRAIGEKWLQKLAHAEARDELAKAARGELKVEKARATAFQAAAVRCLGQRRDPGARAVLEPLLAAPAELVRIQAAEALGQLGDEAAALALVQALERETVDPALVAIAQALRAVYGKHVRRAAADAKPAEAGKDGEAKPAPAAELPESVRLAARAGIAALGRATWRADMAIVDLLDDFRSAEAVPALIAQLERFRGKPEELQSGKLSGLLLHRAHELLVAMTGAVYPADQPEKWRELWEREKDRIAAELPKSKPTGAAKGGGGNTAASGFCGIPVQGTRVVFILDLSGSMNFKMTGEGGKNAATRLDFAKRELLRAMDAIAPNAQFNLVSFNGNPKAKVWNKDMVAANEKNRDRFRKFVEDLDADGGTNLWAGLEEGLSIKSLVYGDRYESHVDEVFVLSDGAPSVGDVMDPIEILRLVKETNRFAKMRINTVFISSTEPQQQPQAPMPWMTITPEELMKRMAEQNGGKFVNL